MEPVVVPRLTVSLAVDLEVEYNSFGGKTADEIVDDLQYELNSLLFELHPSVQKVFTKVTAVDFND